MRLDEGLLARLDVEAGRLGQTRTKFVERALEKALGSPSDDEPVTELSASRTRSPASPRASKAATDYELPKIAPRRQR